MELNITKESLACSEAAFAQNLEHGVDFTVNVPAHCGTVQRILKYSIEPRVFSKSLSGQMLSIDGCADFLIIYIDADGRLSNCEYTEKWSKSVDIGFSTDILSASVSVKCGYLNVKALTPDRLDVHSMLDLSVSVYKRSEREIIGNIECDGMYLSRGEVSAEVFINIVEKNVIIEEEIAFDSVLPSASRILRSSADIKLRGYRIVNDKVIAKGELCVDVLYFSENDGECHKFVTAVPFSQIIDVDGITEECICRISAELSQIQLKMRASADNEIRGFLLSARLSLTVNAFCNKKIPVVFDAYSKNAVTEAEYKSVTFENVADDLSELFVCKKNLDFSDGDVADVLDLLCQCSVRSTKTEGNSIIVSGAVTVSLLAKNSDGVINYFERPFDFEYRVAASQLPNTVRIESEVSVANTEYSVSGDNSIEIKTELSVAVHIFKLNTQSILFSAELSENEEAPANDGSSMLIYYAEKGEKVWEIAKHYRASPDDIKTVNSVSDEITEKIPLLISC